MANHSKRHLPLRKAAFAGDLRAASLSILGLLRDGLTTRAVRREVIAPLMVEIGQRWHDNSLTAAEANQVTGVVNQLVAILANHDPCPDTGPLALVGCVEGERHDLAARLVAAEMSQAGWRVTWLGEAAPAPELRAMVSRIRPAAVLLSCTMASNLPGAARSVATVRETGVPVIVGGAAFGGDTRRAHRVGATAVADDPADAIALLADVAAGVAPLMPSSGSEADSEWSVLERLAPTMSGVALGDLVFSLDAALPESVHQALDVLLGSICGALVVDDEGVALDATRWVAHFLERRGQPGAATTAMLEALDSLFPTRLKGATEVARRCHLVAGFTASNGAAAVRAPACARSRPPRPRNEPARLAAVSRYANLDTEELRASLAGLARVAADALRAPVGGFAIVEENTVRPMAQSAASPRPPAVARDRSVAAHAILERRPLVVPDMSADARFSALPAVLDGPRWRFCAAAPVLVQGSLAVGVLAVLDIEPRSLSPERRDALMVLADQAAVTLELHAVRSEALAHAASPSGHDQLLERVVMAAGDDSLTDGTQLLSTRHVARMLRVSTRTVTNWANQGRLPFTPTAGGHRRFSVDAVADFMASMTTHERAGA